MSRRKPARSRRRLDVAQLEDRTAPAAGVLDTSFAGDGRLALDLNPVDQGVGQPMVLAIQPDGKVLVAGDMAAGNIGGVQLFRVTLDGTLDPTFSPATSDPIYDGGDGMAWLSSSTLFMTHPEEIAVQPDGKIIVVGDFAVVRLTADGRPDPTFGTGGAFRTLATNGGPLASSASNLTSAVVQPDGKILLGGTDVSGSSLNADFIVARLNANGTLDSTFGTGGVARANLLGVETGYDLALQSDGKVVIAGSTRTTTSGSLTQFAAARFNSNGTPDTSFAGTGTFTADLVTGTTKAEIAYGVEIQSDGKLVLVGSCGFTSNTDFAAARLNANGSVDTTFGTNGVGVYDMGVTSSIAYSAAIDSAGRIVLGGWGYPYLYAVARLTPSGALDTSFDGDGKKVTLVGLSSTGANNLAARDVALRRDGTIVMSGRAYAESPYEGTQIGTAYSTVNIGLQVMNPDGSPDTTFSGDGLGFYNRPRYWTDEAYGVALQTDGKVVMVGYTGQFSTSYDDFAVVRLNHDGTPDPTFGGDGDVAVAFGSSTSASEDIASAVAVQPDGKLVVAGSINLSIVDEKMGIARLNPDGTPDLSFGTNGQVVVNPTAMHDNLFAVAIQTDGKILAAGSINNSGSVALAVIRLNPDGTTDTSFGTNGLWTGKLIGTASERLRSIVIQPDGKIVLAGGTTSNSGGIVVRLTANGALDTTFNGTGFRTLAVLPFIGNQVMTVYDLNAVALDPAGRLVVSGKVLNNYTAGGGGGYDFFAARFLTNGALDTTFDGDGYRSIQVGPGVTTDEAWGVAVQQNGRIVLTGTTSPTTNNYDFAAVRLNPDGTSDTTFGSGGWARYDLSGTAYGYPDLNSDDYGRGMALEPGGNIIIAGYGMKVPGINAAASDVEVIRVVGDQLPTDIALSPAAVAENAGANALVGTLTTIDPDAGDTHTYTLVPGVGSANNAQFMIVGNQLRAVASFDYEATPTRTVRVRTTDQTGSYYEEALTVTVLNVNEAPIADAGPDSTNVVNAAITQTGTFTDVDGGSGHTFRWEVTRAGQVVAVGSSQTLTFTPTQSGAHTLRFIVTDPGGAVGSDTATLNVLAVLPGQVPPTLPRDTPADQTLFAPGLTQLAPFAITGGVRAFRFTTDAVDFRDAFTAAVGGTAGQDASLGLYDADGNLVASADSPATGKAFEVLRTDRLRARTEYTLAVFTATTDPAARFTLEVTPPPQSVNATIKINAVSGVAEFAADSGENRLDSPADVDYYALDLTGAGAAGTLTVTPGGREVSPFVTVFRRSHPSDPWVPIATGRAPAGAPVTVPLAPAAGRLLTDDQFLLAVAAGDFDTAARSYEVRVLAAPVVPGAVTVPGTAARLEPVAQGVVRRTEGGDLGTKGFVLRAFTAPATGTIRVSVLSTAIDPLVSVYGSTGELIAAQSLTGSFEQRDAAFDVPVTGGAEYVVRVADVGGHDTGAYTLTLTGSYEPTDVDITGTAAVVTRSAGTLGPATPATFFRIVPKSGTDVLALELSSPTATPVVSVLFPDGRTATFGPALAGQPLFVPLDLAGTVGPVDVMVTAVGGPDAVTVKIGRLAIPDRLDPDDLPGEQINLDTGAFSTPRTAGAFGTKTGATFFNLVPPEGAGPTVVTAIGGAARPVLVLYSERAGQLRPVAYALSDATGTAVLTRALDPDTLYAAAVFPLGFGPAGGAVELSVAGPVPEGVRVRMVPEPNPPTLQPVTGEPKPSYTGDYIARLKIASVVFEAEFQQHLWQTLLPMNVLAGAGNRPVVTYEADGDLGVRITAFVDGQPVQQVDADGTQSFYLNAFGDQIKGKTVKFLVVPRPGQLGDGVYTLGMTVQTTDPTPFQALEEIWDVNLFGQFAVHVKANTSDELAAPGTTPDFTGAVIGGAVEVVQNQFGDGFAVASFTRSAGEPSGANQTGSVDVYKFRHLNPAGPLVVRTEALDPTSDTSIRLYRMAIIDGWRYLVAVEIIDRLNNGDLVTLAPNFDWFPADRTAIDAQIYVSDPGQLRLTDRYNANHTVESGGDEYYVVVKNGAGAYGRYKLVVDAAPVLPDDTTGPTSTVTLRQQQGAADGVTVPSATTGVSAVVTLPDYHTGNFVVTCPTGGHYDTYLFDARGQRLPSTTEDVNSGTARFTRTTFTVPDGPQVLTLRAYIRGTKTGTATGFSIDTSYALPTAYSAVPAPTQTVPADAAFEVLPVGPTGRGELQTSVPNAPGTGRWYRYATGDTLPFIALTSAAGTFRIAGYVNGRLVGKTERGVLFSATDSPLVEFDPILRDVPFLVGASTDVMLYVQLLTARTSAGSVGFTLTVDGEEQEPLRQHELFVDPLDPDHALRFAPGVISTAVQPSAGSDLSLATTPVRNGDWLHATVPYGNTTPVRLTLAYTDSFAPSVPFTYAVYDSDGALVARGTELVPDTTGTGESRTIDLPPAVTGGASYDIQVYRLDRPSGQPDAVLVNLGAGYPLARSANPRPVATAADTYPWDTPEPATVTRAVPDPDGDFTVTSLAVKADPATTGSAGFWVGAAGHSTFTVSLTGATSEYVALYRSRVMGAAEAEPVYDFVLYDYVNVADADGKYRLTADLDPGYYMIRAVSSGAAGTATITANLPAPRTEEIVLNPIIGSNQEANLRIPNRVPLRPEFLGIPPGYATHLVSAFATRYFAVRTPGGSQGPMTFEASAPGAFGIWSAKPADAAADAQGFALVAHATAAKIEGIPAPPRRQLVVSLDRAGTVLFLSTTFVVPDSGTPDLLVDPIELLPNDGQTRVRVTVHNNGYGLALAAPSTFRLSDESLPDSTKWTRLDQTISVLSPFSSQVYEIVYTPVTPDDEVVYIADDQSTTQAPPAADPNPAGGVLDESDEGNNRVHQYIRFVDEHKPVIDSITLADPAMSGLADPSKWGRFIQGVDGQYSMVDVVTHDPDDHPGAAATLYQALLDEPIYPDRTFAAPAAFSFFGEFDRLLATDAAHPNTYTVTVTDVYGLKTRATRTAVVLPRPSWVGVGDSTLTFDRETHTFDLIFEKNVVDYQKTVSKLLLGDNADDDEIPLIGDKQNAFVVRVSSHATAGLNPNGGTISGASSGYALLKILGDTYFERSFNGSEELSDSDGGGTITVSSDFIFNRDDLSIETITGGVFVDDLHLFDWESPEIKLYSYGIPGLVSLNAVIQFGISGDLDAQATVAFDEKALLDGSVPIPVPEGLVAPTYIEPSVTLSATLSGEAEVFGFDVASVDGTVSLTIFVAIGLGTPTDQVLSFAHPEDILNSIKVELSGRLTVEGGAYVFGIPVLEFPSGEWNFEISDPDLVTGNQGAFGNQQNAPPPPPPASAAPISPPPTDGGPPEPTVVTISGKPPRKGDIRTGDATTSAFVLPPTPQLVIDPGTGAALYVQVTDVTAGKGVRGNLKFATGTGATWTPEVVLPQGEHVSNPVLAHTGSGGAAVVTYLVSTDIADPTAPDLNPATSDPKLKEFFTAQDVRYRYWNGTAFSPEQVLTADARFDSEHAVAFNSAGQGVLAWTKNTLANPFGPATGGYLRSSTEIFVSRWGAATHTWTEPVRLTADGVADGRAAVHVGADGTLFVVWLRDGTGGENAIWYSRYESGAWTAPAPLPTAGITPGGRITQLAIGSSGSANGEERIDVLFAHRGPERADGSVPSVIYHRSASAATFGQPADLGTLAANVSPSHLRIAPGGTGLTAYWQEANGVLGEVFAAQLAPPGAGGGTWGRPVQLTSGAAAEQDPSLAIGADGTFETVYWNRTPPGASRDAAVGVPASDGVASSRVRLLPELTVSRRLAFRTGDEFPTGVTAVGTATVVNTGAARTAARIDYLRDGVGVGSEEIILGAGRSFEIHHGFEIAAGSHEYGVRVTPLDFAEEVFGPEDNESFVGVSGGADLIAAGGVSMPAAARAGEPTTLSATVSARGPVSGTVQVAFVKYTTIEVTIPNEPNDVVVTRRVREQLGTVPVSGGDFAHGPRTVTFDWTVPPGAGAFELAAEIDPADAFDEVSEFNNTTATGYRMWPDAALVAGTGSTLTATLLNASGKDNVYLTADVRNLGRAPLTSAVVRAYWSWNDGPYQWVGDKTVKGLTGAQDEEPVPVSFVARGWAGVNRYRLVVDPDGALLDLDHTNNRAEAELYVRGFADLRPGAVAASAVSVIQGRPLDLTAVVYNTGIDTAEDIRVEVFARSATRKRTLVGRADVPAIGPLGQAFVTLPVDTREIKGVITFEVVVDRFNKITELSDRNNTATNALTMTITPDAKPPTADVTNVTPDPRNATVGAVEVVFSEPVSGFDLSDVELLLEGVPVALSGVTIVPVAADRYRLTGLDSRTAADGQYTLRVDPTGVIDLVGLAGIGSASDAWLMDARAPNSHVAALAPVQTAEEFTVTATGTDPSPAPGVPASGIASYDLFVATDDGPFAYWLSVPVAAPSATFRGQNGRAYRFYSLATDRAGNWEPASGTAQAVTTVRLNAPPTDITPHAASVAENSAVGTVVGTLSAVDPDAGDTHSFALVNNAGGRFRIVGGQLQVAGPIDFEATPTLTVRVRATDAGGLPFEKDITITVTNVNEITGFDVQNGQRQRSYIRYLTLTLDSAAAAQALLQTGRVRLVRYDLNGNNPVVVSTGTLSASGNTLTLDFGANGIGGNRNSNVGDGYYRLETDLDGNGTFETAKAFYRLLGDTNGDRKVDDTDVANIDAAISGLPLNGIFVGDCDLNGDGVVNATDRLLAFRYRGRSIAAGLWLDD